MIEEKFEMLLSILNGYKDGKIIQQRQRDGSWQDVKIDIIDIIRFITESVYPLRVKPESEYIPFTFEVAKQLIGKIIKHKNETYNYYMIISAGQFGICIEKVRYSYDELLKFFTFLDGSPCGKLKQ